MGPYGYLRLVQTFSVHVPIRRTWNLVTSLTTAFQANKTLAAFTN